MYYEHQRLFSNAEESILQHELPILLRDKIVLDKAIKCATNLAVSKQKS